MKTLRTLVPRYAACPSPLYKLFLLQADVNTKSCLKLFGFIQLRQCWYGYAGKRGRG